MNITNANDNRLSILECRWAFANKGVLDLRDSVRERETEFGIQKLLNVWAANIRRLFKLINADNLMSLHLVRFDVDRNIFELT
jgi:hypothetical protein